jgi:hypothetical protein
VAMPVPARRQQLVPADQVARDKPPVPPLRRRLLIVSHPPLEPGLHQAAAMPAPARRQRLVPAGRLARAKPPVPRPSQQRQIASLQRLEPGLRRVAEPVIPAPPPRLVHEPQVGRIQIQFQLNRRREVRRNPLVPRQPLPRGHGSKPCRIILPSGWKAGRRQIRVRLPRMGERASPRVVPALQMVGAPRDPIPPLPCAVVAPRPGPLLRPYPSLHIRRPDPRQDPVDPALAQRPRAPIRRPARPPHPATAGPRLPHQRRATALLPRLRPDHHLRLRLRRGVTRPAWALIPPVPLPNPARPHEPPPVRAAARRIPKKTRIDAVRNLVYYCGT